MIPIDRLRRPAASALAAAIVLLAVHPAQAETPPQAQGQGVGSRLVKAALDDARAKGLKVAPRCPFASAYMGRHPEYNDLLA